MRVILTVGFAVLIFTLLTAATRADTIYETNGGDAALIIPDGSTVISIVTVPTIYTQYGNIWRVNYSFQGGTGDTEGNFFFGYTGVIDFSSPVSDVQFDFEASDFFFASDNLGDSATCGGACAGPGLFAGPGVSQINWQGANQIGGIESLSYTLDSAPEPSSLLLSGMGLAALIGVLRRHRAKGPKTIP